MYRLIALACLLLACSLLAVGAGDGVRISGDWLLAPVTGASAAEADEYLETYQDEEGTWSIKYPADWLQPERLSPEVVVFTDQYRNTVLAVDSYVGTEPGNLGENMRNRAADSLNLIFGEGQWSLVFILSRNLPVPWKTGFDFVVGPMDGLEGEALYTQPAATRGPFRAIGVIIAHPKFEYATARPRLEAMRDSLMIKPAP